MKKKYKMIEVGVTCMHGTGAYRKFKASTPEEAIEKAKKRDGDDSKFWTYYCPKFPNIIYDGKR